MPPSTFQEWLDNPFKTQPVVIVEFSGIAQRFITRTIDDTSADLPYLKIDFQTDHKVKILKSEAEIGETTFILQDVKGFITAFLNTNERQLSRILVKIKLGAIGLPEGEFLETLWFLQDYEQTGNNDWSFSVLDVFQALDTTIYENVKQNKIKLRQDFVHQDIVVLLDPEEPPNAWRPAGFALLHDTERGFVEIVQYSAIDAVNNSLPLVSRTVEGVGSPTKVFRVDTTEVIAIWVKRGSPKKIFLEWVLTTPDGSNPTPFDLGTGDGAGLPLAAVDVIGIEAAFDDVDHGVNDWDELFFMSKEINVRKFADKNLLLTSSMTESITDEGKLTVRKFETTPSTTTDLEGNFEKDVRFQYQRNLEIRTNNLLLELDHHAGRDKFETSKSLIVDQSVDRYSKAKPFKMEARGFRGKGGKKFGIPDLDGDDHATTATVRLAELYGIPPAQTRIKAAMRFRKVVPGEAIQITHPQFADPINSPTRGAVDKVLAVTSKRVNHKASKWPVVFRCEIRGRIGRPFIIAPNTHPLTYDLASDAEKETGAYIANNDLSVGAAGIDLGYYIAHNEQT